MGAWVLAAALALAAASPAEAARAVLTDEAIEQRKTELDTAYRKAESEAEEELQANVAFQTRLKDERLEFERLMLVRRKEMLDSLRGLAPAQRQAVYDQFHVDEARRRQEFRERLIALKDSFKRQGP